MESVVKIEASNKESSPILEEIDNFDRVYYGSEFCERLLPSLEETKKFLDVVRELKKNFSLMTPLVTEYGLKKVEAMIRILDKDNEVIVNDYGVLEVVKKKFSNPIVIGRILSRNLLLTLNSIRQDKELLNDYVSIFGSKVKRIETDLLNSEQVNAEIGRIFNFSFYKGPIIWSMTRRCAFNMNRGTLKKFGDCKKECLKSRFIVENEAIKGFFLFENNKILGLNHFIGKDVDYKLFDRIVSI